MALQMGGKVLLGHEGGGGGGGEGRGWLGMSFEY